MADFLHHSLFVMEESWSLCMKDFGLSYSTCNGSQDNFCCEHSPISYIIRTTDAKVNNTAQKVLTCPQISPNPNLIEHPWDNCKIVVLLIIIEIVPKYDDCLPMMIGSFFFFFLVF